MIDSLQEIKRGDIWFMNLSPSTGKEKKGIHPVLIIQNNIGNTYSELTIIAAITGNLNKYPVTVLLKPSKMNGLKKTSAIQCDQIYTIDKNRLKNKLGDIEKKHLKEVDTAIRISLAI